jgi:hypothetical protein
MDGRLFMADKDLVKGGMLEFVKERKNHATRIVEESIHPFSLEAFNDDLRTRLFHKRTVGGALRPEPKIVSGLRLRIAPP